MAVDQVTFRAVTFDGLDSRGRALFRRPCPIKYPLPIIGRMIDVPPGTVLDITVDTLSRWRIIRWQLADFTLGENQT